MLYSIGDIVDAISEHLIIKGEIISAEDGYYCIQGNDNVVYTVNSYDILSKR